MRAAKAAAAAAVGDGEGTASSAPAPAAPSSLASAASRICSSTVGKPRADLEGFDRCRPSSRALSVRAASELRVRSRGVLRTASGGEDCRTSDSSSSPWSGEVAVAGRACCAKIASPSSSASISLAPARFLAAAATFSPPCGALRFVAALAAAFFALRGKRLRRTLSGLCSPSSEEETS